MNANGDVAETPVDVNYWTKVQIVAAPETQLFLTSDQGGANGGVLTLRLFAPGESTEEIPAGARDRLAVLKPPDECLVVTARPQTPDPNPKATTEPEILFEEKLQGVYRVFSKVPGHAVLIQDIEPPRLMQILNGPDSNLMTFCSSFDQFKALCDDSASENLIPMLIERIAATIVPEKKTVWTM